MRLRYTLPALADLTSILDYIADRSPQGAARVVFGVIVAKSISENLRYAASIVPNVFLYEYEVEFHLHLAQELTSTS